MFSVICKLALIYLSLKLFHRWSEKLNGFFSIIRGENFNASLIIQSHGRAPNCRLPAIHPFQQRKFPFPGL